MPEGQATDPSLSIIDTPAHEAILSILKAEPPNTVHILSLGPCRFSGCRMHGTIQDPVQQILVSSVTTVAQAIRADPETMHRAARLVTMGGAIDCAGNTSANAEFNFFADPYVRTSYTAPGVLFTSSIQVRRRDRYTCSDSRNVSYGPTSRKQDT